MKFKVLCFSCCLSVLCMFFTACGNRIVENEDGNYVIITDSVEETSFHQESETSFITTQESRQTDTSETSIISDSEPIAEINTVTSAETTNTSVQTTIQTTTESTLAYTGTLETEINNEGMENELSPEDLEEMYKEQWLILQGQDVLEEWVSSTAVEELEPPPMPEFEYNEEFTTTEAVPFEIPAIDDSIVNDLKTGVVEDLPYMIQSEVDAYKKKYPGIRIGVGVYTLDGKSGYEYNATSRISSACTSKAPYSLFVLCRCSELGIDIETEYIVYEKRMRNDGSGIIKDSAYGTKYTISYLLDVLLDWSDNTAYNMLVSRFPISEYQKFLNTFDGQKMDGLMYGSATVRQRRNEWVEIWKYINGNYMYSDLLKQYLNGTHYCYLVQWMNGKHSFLHKSGWSDGDNYTSASDVAIIDNKYLVIVLTDDYSTGKAHTDVVKAIGAATQRFVDSGNSIF